MLIKLTLAQFDYFNRKLKVERPDLFVLLSHGSNEPFVIDSNIASDIRDWLGVKLQAEGFDNSYELNQEGKLLEDLIDLFYE